MRYQLIIPTIILALNCNILSAQLSPEEKKEMLSYLQDRMPFVSIDPKFHQEMVNDASIVHLLRPCVPHMKKSNTLKVLWEYPENKMNEMYSMLFSKMGSSYQ